MGTVKLREMLGRPRVFTIVNSEGVVDSLRFDAKQSLEFDDKLLTSVLVDNIKRGALILIDGKIPKKLYPYTPKENYTVATQAAKQAEKKKTASKGVSDDSLDSLAKAPTTSVEEGSV